MPTIIAAIAANRAIGYKNKLVITDPLDMELFRLSTTGNTVVMGKSTADSLPLRYLPNRDNHVLTRNTELKYKFINNRLYFPDLQSAVASSTLPVFIIGGQSIYEQALSNPQVDKIILTEYKFTPTKSDSFFPELSPEWELVKSIPYKAIIKQTDTSVLAHINTYKRKQ